MLWIIISTVLVFLISLGLGYKKLLYLDEISPRSSLITLILSLALLLFARYLFDIGWMPEQIAAATMAGTYASIAGFFMGSGIRHYQFKTSLGTIKYVNRALLTDLIPNVIALTLIIAGIARTSLLSELAVTPIRISSGLSMIAIGFFALTIRLIPEFRSKGIVILDRIIPWEDFVNYQWYGENVIEIEYEYQDKIMSYRTVIPAEDHLKIEDLLAKKMMEKLEED